MGELAMTEKPTGEVVRKPYKREIVWPNAIGFLAYHLAAIYGAYWAFTEAKLLSWIWGFSVGIFCGLGIGIGAHRFYTHRCFKANWQVRLALVVAHTIAGQNCLYIWVREHRQHHKYTDTNADPHNATRGFFFSHIGWLMCRKHPDVVEKGKTTDMSDLEADPFIMFQKKYYKTLYVIFAIALPMIVPIYAWNESFRVAFWSAYVLRSVIVLNITWLVNSAAHMYGVRPYNNKIQPVESKIVSFLSFGEGWHNYHHTFPWDYRASELGQRYDWSTTIIDWMARKGWVYDLRQAPQSMVNRWVQKYGDGTHAVYGVNGLLGSGVGEIKNTPDKCAVTDLEAFKNIEKDDFVNDDEQICNGKQSYVRDTTVIYNNTAKVR